MNVLETANKIVHNDRKAEYGGINESFGRIAKLWSNYLDVEITALDVAMMMVLLKVSRAKGNPKSVDSYVDIAGYAECAGILLDGD